MRYNLLVLKKWNFKRLKKERPNYLHFIDSEGPGPLPTYP